MKLSEYARRVGVHDKTAWRWWRAGPVDASQAASGTVMMREAAEPATPSPATRHVAISARVWVAEHRPTLARRAERLLTSCAAKGYQAHQAHQAQQVVKAIGSGVNESRPQFLQALADPTIKVVVVEHKERATRFGFRSLDTLLE